MGLVCCGWDWEGTICHDKVSKEHVEDHSEIQSRTLPLVGKRQICGRLWVTLAEVRTESLLNMLAKDTPGSSLNLVCMGNTSRI